MKLSNFIWYVLYLKPEDVIFMKRILRGPLIFDWGFDFSLMNRMNCRTNPLEYLLEQIIDTSELTGVLAEHGKDR